jgi:multimeric flavodoxin WrbA
MLKILGFNGSPRPRWNTAELVKKVLEGAASKGASTAYFDLGTLDIHPCRSCLVCKKGPGFEGRCHYQDDFPRILEKLKNADGFVVGAPCYMGLPAGLAHAFLERLTFSSYAYRRENSAVFGKPIKAGLVFTFGADEKWAKKSFEPAMDQVTGWFERLFGGCEKVCSYDCQQVADYRDYDIRVCVPEEKYERRRTEFPKDLQAAFEMGCRLATK